MADPFVQVAGPFGTSGRLIFASGWPIWYKRQARLCKWQTLFGVSRLWVAPAAAETPLPRTVATGRDPPEAAKMAALHAAVRQRLRSPVAKPCSQSRGKCRSCRISTRSSCSTRSCRPDDAWGPWGISFSCVGDCIIIAPYGASTASKGAHCALLGT